MILIHIFFLFRQLSMKMHDLMLKFPHLPEQIFQKLNNESLLKCREVAKSWQNIIDGRNYPWLRIVNIPTILKKGSKYLHLAAKNGQIEAYKEALNEKENKNMRTKFCGTSFHLACKNGRIQIVVHLLEIAQAAKEKRDMNFGPQQHEKMLLAYGFPPFPYPIPPGLDPSMHMHMLTTDTVYKAKYEKDRLDKEKAFKVQVDHDNRKKYNPNLNAKTKKGYTAFHWTCIKGHSKILTVIMENATALGVDLNAKTKTGITAFHLACKTSNSDVIEIFMQNAADLRIDLNVIDSNGWTGFHHACQHGHLDVVKIFMENAAALRIDLNIIDNYGFSGCHQACVRGHADVVKILMENAAVLSIDLNGKGINGKTAFHLACEAGSSDVVKIFMENAAALSIDLNTIDKYDKTGFYLACGNGHLDVIKIFIENAAALSTDFELTNTDDFYACVRRHPNVFKLLKENADVLIRFFVHDVRPLLNNI